MIYQSWGFTGSPFQTTSLPASGLGEKLLVGRDTELATLMRRIASPPKLATLEGLNGVGKTSVVNVACHKLFSQHVRSSSGPLYVPCRRIFQLNPNQDLQSFIDHVLMEVAQTIIDIADQIRQTTPELHTVAVDRWLNSAQHVSFQGGMFSVQAGYQSETNTSAGFERSGFRKAVARILEQIFPDADSGGVICTIDNLELLQSSDAARQQLEQLRDELLNMQGLRWVLCGALGIVFGVVASPRLEGYLHAPIEVGKVSGQHAADILRGRLSAYSHSSKEQYLPLLPDDFARLYELLRGNLRSVLSYSDDYCQWVADHEPPVSEDDKRKMFDQWLTAQAESAYSAVHQEIQPRVAQTFRTAVRVGGVFSPSDFEEFGFNSVQAFRPSIRELEAVGLLVSTRDDGDKRRKTIQITPKGWFVDMHYRGNP